MPGAAHVAAFADDELSFSIDWVTVIDHIIENEAEVTFILARSKALATTFSITDRTAGKKLCGVLCKPATNDAPGNLANHGPRIVFFGKKKNDGANAPVSEAATFAYTTALNALLAAKRGVDEKSKPIWQNRVQIGDATTVFWAEVPLGAGPGAVDEAELMIAALIDPPPSAGEENAKLRDALAKIEAGRPIEEAAPGLHEQTRAYTLGLAPNAARISIRFWLDGTLGELAENIGKYWRHLAIEPKPWTPPPTAWRLLSQLAPLRRKPQWAAAGRGKACAEPSRR